MFGAPAHKAAELKEHDVQMQTSEHIGEEESLSRPVDAQ